MGKKIEASTSVAEIVRLCRSARRIFDRHGLKGCGGQNGPAEPLEFFARVHWADLHALLEDLNAEIEKPEKDPYVYHETLADYIYRRFFKSAIAIVLSIGGLWGLIAILKISFGKSLLQPQLLPMIHAHAHAMIFGWVGLFVMGFAYQSFPRFKLTILWRPGLANLTLYLMLFGIVFRFAGDTLGHGALVLTSERFPPRLRLPRSCSSLLSSSRLRGNPWALTIHTRRLSSPLLSGSWSRGF